MPTRSLSDAQMLRGITAVKNELRNQGVTYHYSGGFLSVNHQINLKAMISAIADGLASWPDRAPRQWALIERINQIAAAQDEGWALFVCSDGMIVIEADTDAEKPAEDAYSYVERRARMRSIPHEAALGLHGMMMTEER